MTRSLTPSVRLVAALLFAAGLRAQDLPTPIFLRADPQMVYPNSPGWLDGNGRVVVYLQGENLSPDDDLGHPSGPDGGYQHLFIRGVSPHGDKATAWMPCTASNGCITYGGAARSVIILAADPSRFLSEPGSHLQVKLWVSLGADGADDPEHATNRHSGWSAIKTIDVAPAGATKPAPKVTSETPILTRVVPSNFTLMAPTPSYRLRIYGDNLCGTGNTVVFNGDTAHPVPAEDGCTGRDDDGSFLPEGRLFHVTLPERYRRTTPGQLTVAIVNPQGQSQTRVITFSAMTAKAAGFPGAQAVRGGVLATPRSLGAAVTGPQQASLPPAILRLTPATLRIGTPPADWRLEIYGVRLGKGPVRVAFDGDLVGAVPAEVQPAPSGEQRVLVVLPERYRRRTAGTVKVRVLAGQAQTQEVELAFTTAPVLSPLGPQLRTPPGAQPKPPQIIHH
jgi:hypothetical protein